MLKEQDSFIESLFHEYYRELVIYSFRFVHDWTRANEVAQDAFHVACRRIEKIMDSPSPVGWLKLTAKNIALQMERNRYREKNLLLSSEEATELTMMSASSDIELDIEILYNGLISKDEFYLLKRFLIDKATYLELSKELGLELWTCQKRMQRLLKKLRQRLDDENKNFY